MINLREIHKPKTIEEAIGLLKQPDTVVIAGGTDLLASYRRDVRAVVDLSGLGLDYIREENGEITIGAMTTLADVVESPMLRAVANAVLAQAAHRSAANLLRNQATVVGTLITEPDGILAVALAALDSQVVCTGAEAETIPLTDLLMARDHFVMCGIITQVLIPAQALAQRAALETVARTPRDKPIVSICAALELEDDTVRSAAIALGGVSETAVRAGEVENWLVSGGLCDEVIERAARQPMEGLNPPSDFRGSAEYRREMARVLTARVLRKLMNRA